MHTAMLDRRRLLSGGLTMAFVALTSAPISALPNMVTAAADGEFAEAESGYWIPELVDAEEVFGLDLAEVVARHARFRAAFADWLEHASARLARPMTIGAQAGGVTDLTISGLHPALAISLQGEREICVFVNWDGIGWGMLTNMLVRPPRAERGASHGAYDFEPLLAWLDGELASATHLALYGEDDDPEGDGWTAVHLARDGMLIHENRPVVADRRLRHLLPLRADDAARVIAGSRGDRPDPFSRRAGPPW